MMVFGFSGLRLWRAIAVTAIFTLPVYGSSLANPVASKPGILAFSAFSLQPKGNGLFTITADGRNRRRMTRVQDINSSVWSPDGKKLAFTANSDQDVYVINADGSQLITVFQGDFCKASSLGLNWTADSQQLVFVRSCDPFVSDGPGLQALYVRNLARGARTKLIREWEIGGFAPVNEIDSAVFPSPDGRQVSFIKNQNLYRMNSDGSGLTRLTDGNQPPQPDFTQLYWSPDSRKIARMDFFSGDVPGQQISIFNRDGKLLGQWRNSGINWSNPNLIWSPDSQRLAYYQTEGSQQNIYLYDLAETAPRNLTRRPGEYNHIVWSPDGQQIAFQLKTEQDSKLYAIAVEQAKWTTLMAQTVKDEIEDIAWSPNSQQLAFTVLFNLSYSNLYVVNRDGSGLKPLTFGQNATVSGPAWRP